VSLVSNVRGKKRLPVLQMLKTIAAAVAAWYLTLLIIPDEKPIFSVMAAIIVVQPSVNQSLGRALERSIGTILGVVVALGASMAFGAPGWLVILAITVAIFLGWIFKFTPATSNQIAISAMLVIAIGAATPEYALHRIAETLVGVVVGLIINAVIVPPVILTPAIEATAKLTDHIASVLEDMGAVLTRTTSQQVIEEIYLRARALRGELNTARATVDRARESLRFNIRQSRKYHELEALSAFIDLDAVLVTRTIGLARALRDHYDESLTTEPAIQEIADELGSAGHDLRMRARDAHIPAVTIPHPPTSELPALTSPIQLKAPAGANWILVGFYLESLRRIRAEIMGEESD
jgi:uncharacterized membrane protein YgaE (UPF0421/DUF939 family)